ncbi:MAG TPA: toll/interleukin-1 receptor domain-containing protein [Terriglobales bacterium]|jgi:hypothetical protein|nr:toll/interleukin-1 receptor domain-containing protein [Terriglobales bacterium]
MLKVFVSYHHNARKTAGRVKDSLTVLGMDVFLAHEDLEPSSEWQQDILRALKKCDVFIPLLTRSFHSSLWTDQETGIAVARGKVILPLRFSVLPYGFIGKFQALKAQKDLQGTCWKIAANLASKPAFKEAVTEGVITAFLQSSNFEESARRAKVLPKFEPFSAADLNRIVQGSAKNSQIFGGWAARDCVRKLIRENSQKIRRVFIRKFEERVRSWG